MQLSSATPKITKAIIMAEKYCSKCGTTKDINGFYSYTYTTSGGNRSCRRDSYCKACKNLSRKIRRSIPEVKARAKELHDGWKKKNKEHLTKYRAKKQLCTNHRANKAKAQRLRKARLRANSDNKDPRIAALYTEAIQLQRKLQESKMSNDPLELQVHVDHIMPLCRGGKHVYENLQLLSGRQNLAKGGNFPLRHDIVGR